MSEWEPNTQQREISEDIEGMMVVDAGPGTGKTETMIHRYANIISSGVGPEEVMMITFTNGAADEMAGRLSRLVCPRIPTRYSQGPSTPFVSRL